jgi:hypothetical protein
VEFITVLWLPILLSAVFVFVASSVLHMVLPYHKGDYRKLPGEENILELMRKEGVQPGYYAFPRAESMKEMGNPDIIAKWEKGPVGFAAIIPSGKPGMSKSLTQWFLYTIVVSIFAAYLGRAFLAETSEYMHVFRMTGAVAFVAYGIGTMQESIWRGIPWSGTIKHVFDGLIYALLTAGVFGWLWPG